MTRRGLPHYRVRHLCPAPRSSTEQRTSQPYLRTQGRVRARRFHSGVRGQRRDWTPAQTRPRFLLRLFTFSYLLLFFLLLQNQAVSPGKTRTVRCLVVWEGDSNDTTESVLERVRGAGCALAPQLLVHRVLRAKGSGIRRGVVDHLLAVRPVPQSDDLKMNIGLEFRGLPVN